MSSEPTREVWRALERELRPFVARRVAPSDVDDVVQEVLLRLNRGLERLRDEERLGAWVNRVARHVVVDHHRARGRRPSEVGEASEDVVAERRTTELFDGTPEAELAGYVAIFVAALPSPYREALTLTELEGLSQTRGRRDARGVAFDDEVSRAARSREASRGLRGVLRGLARRASSRRRVRAAGGRSRTRLVLRGWLRFGAESEAAVRARAIPASASGTEAPRDDEPEARDTLAPREVGDEPDASFRGGGTLARGVRWWNHRRQWKRRWRLVLL
ncbi:MAG: hypothetical protein H6721_12005 [Sandaracinus sp.]|nr:hypothetical protein [Sandaracinus sp.]